jgi:hypothetical protein
MCHKAASSSVSKRRGGQDADERAPGMPGNQLSFMNDPQWDARMAAGRRPAAEESSARFVFSVDKREIRVKLLTKLSIRS